MSSTSPEPKLDERLNTFSLMSLLTGPSLLGVRALVKSTKVDGDKSAFDLMNLARADVVE